MIVGNFFNIKNTNGLLYYGIDYLLEQPALVRKVLVREAMAEAVRRLMPGIEVQACTLGGLVREAFAAARRGDLLYAPTPHPLPFIARQWVVTHDSYPFTARLGGLKRFLLRASLATSRCRVGYINESETLPFLRRLGIGESRLMFAPNRIPSSPGFTRRVAAPSDEPLRVGVLGTDSPKKNYNQLFDAVLAARAERGLRFHGYGHRCPYYADLVRDYPSIDFPLFESDRCGLPEFLSDVDVLVSIADQEGFGRPIALGMAGGLPCLLLSKPVFREFFSGARFFDDVPALVAALGDRGSLFATGDAAYAPAQRVVLGYREAVSALQRQGAGQ